MNSNTEQPAPLTENLKSLLQELIEEAFNTFKQELFDQLETSSEKFDRTENYHPNELLKPTQAASILKISTKTLSRWRKSGNIAYTAVEGNYFYKYKDIQAKIESYPTPDYQYSKYGKTTTKRGRPSILIDSIN